MALKGKQKKLDRNNNNRIDAQDFKILKAEKAKGRGMGLQDEKVKPGKVMKAKRGSGLDLPVIKSVKPKINKKSLHKNLMKTKNPYSDLVKTTAKGPPRFSSMAEMRKAKGFKPGETPEAFNKRKAAEKLAKTAGRAGTIGKIALGVAAAGIGAKKYLESKMKKDKKMGGGMMNKPMGYKDGRSISTRGGGVDASILGKFRDISAKGGFRPIPTDVRGRMTESDKQKVRDLIKRRNRKEKVKSIIKSVIPGAAIAKGAKAIIGGTKSSGMGGAGRRGSINRTPPKKIKVMEARTGQMVMARGCKLGRKKATKIT